MLKRVKRQVASWFRSLWPQLKDNLQQGKLLIFLVGGALAGLNLTIDPSFFVTVPAGDCPHYLTLLENGTCPINEPNIKAAGFTLITAIALFASVLSDPKTLVDKAVERGIRLLGVASAFGAGWFWLEAETFGQSWAYVGAMLLIVGLGVYAIIGSGFFIAGAILTARLIWSARKILFNLFVLTLVWSVLVLIASILCLWKTISSIWRFLKSTVSRLFPLTRIHRWEA